MAKLATQTPIQAGEPSIVEVGEGIEFVSSGVGGREVDRKAKELQDKFKLPKPPGKRNVPFNQFVDYLDLLTPEMWGHVEIYVYRRRPVVDNKQADPNAYNYIDVVNEPLNLDYMINTHGGGDYGFTMKDRNSDATVCEADLTIAMSQYEPILDYRTLDMNSRTNKTYIKRLKASGILTDDGEVNTVAATGSGKGETAILSKLVDSLMMQVNKLTDREQQQLRNAATADPASAAIIRIMEKGHEQSLKMVQGEKDAGGPNQTIQLITAIMTMMQSLAPAKGDSPSWETILKMQSDNHKAVLEIIKENKDAQATKETKGGLLGTLGELTQLKEVLDTLGLTDGGKRGGRREWYEAVLENLAPVAERALGTVDKYLDYSMKVAGGSVLNQQRPQPTTTSNPTANNPQQTVVIHPSGPQPVPNQPTIEVEPVETRVVQQDQIIQGAISLIQSHGPLIIEHMNGSGDGAIFADNLVNMFGRPMYNRIKQLGSETLLKAMQAVPDFWTSAQACLEGTPESVNKWVDEFMGYPETLPPEEPEVE